VIQGGGYRYNPANNTAPHIDTQPPIVNEFGVSNTRGTVAMAKLGGDPNSATSEWFVNLADNSANLDTQNGGFTVFGRVIGDGMDVVDQIATLPRANFGGAFASTPTINYQGAITADIFVTLDKLSVTLPVTDSDSDGVGDNADAFPSNANETADTDADGLGDNYEQQYGLTATDTASTDSDSDGLTNLQEFNLGTSPVDLTSPGLAGSVAESARRDFNGDGTADLLIRNSNGGWWLYLMNGTGIVDQGRIAATPSLDWQPVSFADFSGDGRADILLRHRQRGVW